MAGLLVLGGAYALATAIVMRRTAEKPERGRVTIHVSHWQLERGVRQGFEAMIRRYEEINPRVRVVQIVAPDNLYPGWVMAQVVGGDAPDIIEYNKDFSGYVVQQYFAPISEEVAKPNPYNRGTPLEKVPWRDTLLDSMSSEDGFNRRLNQYYAVTLSQHSMRIVYNRPLLRAITGSDDPPGDYQALLALYAKTWSYARGHPGIIAPIANSQDTVIGVADYIFTSAISRIYARIDRRHAFRTSNNELGLAYLRGDWSLRDPEAMTGLLLLREFGQNSVPGFLQLTRDSAVTDFVSGRSVMIAAPSWEATSFKDLCNFELGVFRYPVPLQGDPVYGKNMLGPYSDGRLITWMTMYLNRNSPHRAEALDFMRFITSREGDQIFSDVSGWLPATAGVRASDAFSRKFMPIYDGYFWDSDFFTLTGEDARQVVRGSYHLLFGPAGSPQKYAAGVDRDIRPAIISDLLRDLRLEVQSVNRQDSAAAAVHLLADGAGTAPLPLLPARLEGRTYQMADIIRKAQSSREPGPRPAGVPKPEPGSARPSPAAPGPASAEGLISGWRALANYQPDQALPSFESLATGDGQGARLARFGSALSLLAKESAIPGRVERARTILSALAVEGQSDDLAAGALFFLARIYENHLDRTNPAEAARLFGRLIEEHASSVWAQAAVPRLAILLLYTPAGPVSPPARVAAAAGLLGRARQPLAIAELHLVIADAIFHYRLPDAQALPHLLAAEKTGTLDISTRADVLAQIAELSRLTGNQGQAQRYFRTFLSEYPHDFRRYAISQSLGFP